MTRTAILFLAALTAAPACSNDDSTPTLTYDEACDALATASCARYEECDYWIQGLNGGVVFEWSDDDRIWCEIDAWGNCIAEYNTSGNSSPVSRDTATDCLIQSLDSVAPVCSMPPAACLDACAALGNENHAELYDPDGNLYIYVVCASPE